MYALLDVKTLDLLTKPLYSNEVLPYVKEKIRAKYLPNLFFAIYVDLITYIIG